MVGVIGLEILFDEEFHARLHTPVLGSLHDDPGKVWKVFVSEYPDMQRYSDSWLASRALDIVTSIQLELPSANFPAIDFIEANVPPSAKVFAYDVGGSTLYLWKRFSEVVCVDYDPGWFDVGRQLVDRGLSSFSARAKLTAGIRRAPQLFLQEGTTVASEKKYLSSAPGYSGVYFKEYCELINDWPKHHFNLVFTSGRARLGALINSAEAIAPGGVLVFDNSDIAQYGFMLTRAEATFLEGWKKFEFLGPGAFGETIGWKTSIYQKPEG